MFQAMERKNLFINACTFVCGLVVGGALVYLINRNDAKITEETVAGSERDYPQVYGLDLSFWQGNIHWDQLSLPCDEDGSVSGKIPVPLKQRPVQFAFIRVTKSDSLVDSLYQNYYTEAKKLGIPCGAYHFLTDTVSGKVQAEIFLSHARLEPGDLPPVLDVEPNDWQVKVMGGANVLLANVRQWLEIVYKQTGQRPILYVGQTFAHKYLTQATDITGNYLVWVARYGEYQPTWKLTIWQLSPDGRVNGIHGNVDINVFDGKCPAGNVGIQVNHIDPVNKGEIVWTVDPTAVIFFGRLFNTGKVNLTRTIAIAGSEVKEPAYADVLVGAKIGEPIRQTVGRLSFGAAPSARRRSSLCQRSRSLV